MDKLDHYVTLFDNLFLPQGVALHLSMERHIKNYKLWILCVDDETFKVLTKLKLSNVQLLQLKILETPELQDVKSTRTKGEYCWTLTPFAPRFVFEADQNVSRVTYLDADLWFIKSPLPIFNELDKSCKKVLITDHAYSPEYDQSDTAGKYCVQFMTFQRHQGESVRKWWEGKCIEWCFARFEGGKFGDQKYLDDWPERFPELVHVLQQKEFCLAPWNASRFTWNEAVFFHFHGLRIVDKGRIDFGPTYPLPPPLIKNIYEPYIEDLKNSINILTNNGHFVRPQSKKRGFIAVAYIFMMGFYRQLWRLNLLNSRRY